MTLGARIESQRKAVGISQAELARRVGVRQSTINGLINGDARSSRSIVAIARELHTTAAYLAGDIDDPAEGASPPTPVHPFQHVTLQAVLPNEDALAIGFEAILLASRSMSEIELARELARRLPTLLRVVGDVLAAPPSDEDAVLPDMTADPRSVRHARRRAARA